MTEFSEECKKELSTESFVSGAFSNGAVWGGVGFFAGETFFGVGGAPGGLAGIGFGQLVNIASFGIEYISCKTTNKNFGHAIFGDHASPSKPATDNVSGPKPGIDTSSPAKLPKVNIE